MSFITPIRTNNTASLLTAEVLGVNIPRVLLARTPEERFDVATFETMNTVGFFGTGFLVDKLLNRVFKSAADLGPKAKFYARAGHSLGMLSMLASVMVASSYARNYMTAKVEKKTDFTDVIQGQPSQTEPALTKKQERTLLKEEKHSLKRAIQTLGVGLASSVLITGAGFLAMKGKLKLPEVGAGTQRFLEKHLFLGLNKAGQSSFNRISDPSAMLFWVMPSYAGAIVNSRDSVEAQEQAIKFMNFTACFFLLPKLIERGVPTALKALKGGHLPEKEALLNAQYVTKQITQVALLAGTTVLYQYLTDRKLAAEEARSASLTKSSTQAPSSPTAAIKASAMPPAIQKSSALPSSTVAPPIAFQSPVTSFHGRSLAQALANPSLSLPNQFSQPFISPSSPHYFIPTPMTNLPPGLRLAGSPQNRFLDDRLSPPSYATRQQSLA